MYKRERCNVQYSDQEQESLRDGGDGGGRRSFHYDACSRVVEHLEFIEGGDEAVEPRTGIMGAQGGTKLVDLT